ncbi:MAG: hypothetical protein M1832_003050 [Thelocarpon impressellum]|nr:MAG: hypothetical protein M1832_003050 [Thelocarpon impressellum]
MPPGGQGPPPFSEFPGVAHNEPPTPHENSAGQGPPSGSDPPGVSDDEPPASCQNSDGQGPPSGPDPPGVSLYEPFARHIQTKIDQIAYVTNDLLSLTLIATIYGMNLDIFVDGGLSDLKKYLVTALPFAAGIFFLTFYLPTFRLSTFRLKSSPTRRGRNVNVDVV